VLNSLPFFGSYGGVILAPSVVDGDRVKLQLIEAFHQLAGNESVVASTIIANPLQPDREFYDRHCHATLHDDRIGQITSLPPCDPQETLADRLANSFHSNTRKNIRRALKSGFAVTRSDSQEAFDALASIHRRNMEAIGGRVKDASVFSALRRSLSSPEDYVIYTAARGEQIIAALLVLFFNHTAEYFIPATEESFRVHQPSSLLVFEAMQDAVERGCRYWNWGGTWLSQEGVYRYKSRWNTKDYPYRYHIREYDDQYPLRNYRQDELAAEYPFYYVVPYRVLRPERDA
jgi:hypothetical protein